jgi:hypothetical protein
MGEAPSPAHESLSGKGPASLSLNGFIAKAFAVAMLEDGDGSAISLPPSPRFALVRSPSKLLDLDLASQLVLAEFQPMRWSGDGVLTPVGSSSSAVCSSRAPGR